MSEHTINLSEAVWRKASYSTGNGADCLEVANLNGLYRMVRDSKDPAGPVLTVSLPGWSAFTASVRADQFS